MVGPRNSAEDQVEAGPAPSQSATPNTDVPSAATTSQCNHGHFQMPEPGIKVSNTGGAAGGGAASIASPPVHNSSNHSSMPSSKSPSASSNRITEASATTSSGVASMIIDAPRSSSSAPLLPDTEHRSPTRLLPPHNLRSSENRLTGIADDSLPWLQALELNQVVGACRSDERLRPFLRWNVSCFGSDGRLLAHLGQHFKARELALLAYCLCTPLVSLRVGKVVRHGRYLYPTSARGYLNLMLLPWSEMRLSFADDAGAVERVAVTVPGVDGGGILIDELEEDASGRTFVLKDRSGNITHYFWQSEKLKSTGDESIVKIRSMLKRRPSIAQLTGIDEGRLDSFADYLRTGIMALPRIKANSTQSEEELASENGVNSLQRTVILSSTIRTDRDSQFTDGAMGSELVTTATTSSFQDPQCESSMDKLRRCVQEIDTSVCSDSGPLRSFANCILATAKLIESLKKLRRTLRSLSDRTRSALISHNVDSARNTTDHDYLRDAARRRSSDDQSDSQILFKLGCDHRITASVDFGAHHGIYVTKLKHLRTILSASPPPSPSSQAPFPDISKVVLLSSSSPDALSMRSYPTPRLDVADSPSLSDSSSSTWSYSSRLVQLVRRRLLTLCDQSGRGSGITKGLSSESTDLLAHLISQMPVVVSHVSSEADVWVHKLVYVKLEQLIERSLERQRHIIAKSRPSLRLPGNNIVNHDDHQLWRRRASHSLHQLTIRPGSSDKSRYGSVRRPHNCNNNIVDNSDPNHVDRRLQVLSRDQELHGPYIGNKEMNCQDRISSSAAQQYCHRCATGTSGLGNLVLINCYAEQTGPHLRVVTAEITSGNSSYIVRFLQSF